jgi:hypothetical protein
VRAHGARYRRLAGRGYGADRLPGGVDAFTGDDPGAGLAGDDAGGDHQLGVGAEADVRSCGRDRRDRLADLLGDNGGTFAFDGLQAAARRAKDAAGDKDVLVLGAHVAGQLLKAGLLDEVRIHLLPLLLGEGTPLFAGERAELIPEGQPVTGAVTHLRYRVAKPCRRISGKTLKQFGAR